MKSRCEKSRGVRVSEFFKNCRNTLKESSGEMKKSNPEKMGTSMWINREDPGESQGRECVQQIAHLVGIVLNDAIPTMSWLTNTCRKNPEIGNKIFSLYHSRALVALPYQSCPRWLWKNCDENAHVE